jgi:hypothetical protein
VLHQDFSGQVQSDLERGIPNSYLGYAMRLLSTKSPCNLSPSPTWRRTWIAYSRSEKGEPPFVRWPPVFDKYSDLDDDAKPFSGSYLGLAITLTQQGWFVYWKHMEPSELLKYDSRLVAFTQELPFQEGKSLSPIIEEGEDKTKLFEYSSSSEFSPDLHIFMASLRDHNDNDEPGREYDDELLADISADETTADASQNKDEELKESWLCLEGGGGGVNRRI